MALPFVSPVPNGTPPKLAWDGPRGADDADAEQADEAALANRRGPSSKACLALELASTAVLCAALFVAPTWLLLMLSALLWKGAVDIAVFTLLFLLVLAIILVPCCLPCCSPGCWQGRRLAEWLRRRRRLVVASLLLGCLAFLVLFLVMFHVDLSVPDVSSDYDAAVPVAVVGAGPSGLAAAWMLAKGGRKVTIFESLDDIGGHAKSLVIDHQRDFRIDLGFIFNNAAGGSYESYKAFAEHFQYELETTALNTSGYFGGEYWDNTGDAGRFDPALSEEIDRFYEFVNQPETTLRFITPFGFWLWWHGFTARFRKLCMDSTMSVLFVTKMGLDKQSAQAVLLYFKENGFTHLRYDKPKVQFSPKGSQFMWREVVADMVSTGDVQVKLNSTVDKVQSTNERWRLTLADGSEHAGFGDVVLACPANVASRIVRGRGLGTGLVSQIEYVKADVTLHTDADATLGKGFEQASDHVLYFVSHNHMTGKIGNIFRDRASDLLLSVHGQESEPLKIDPAKTKWKTEWEHHYFSLWEIVVARKLVPMFNGNGGLHFAGDWLFGVGHDDAIKSGVHAACMAGLPVKPLHSAADPLYSRLLAGVCTLPE